jgi:NADP-dependent 3-hydroxy acid dehydrogenase YdfG
MTDHTTIAGRTVCVTGPSSGFGRLIAEHLGCLGAHVFLNGRTTPPMDETAATIRAAGGQADVATFDVTDIAALQGWVAGAAEATGRLDVMVSNAGFGDLSPILEGDPATWKEMLDVNVLALAVGAQAAVRAMRATGSHGHLINISSTASLRRDSGMYGASKYAVNAIGSTLRQELEDDPIRVTTIKPGAFATNFSRNMPREMVEGLAAMIGMENPEFDEQGRLPDEQLAQVQAAMSTTLGDPTDIARTVEWLITQPIELNIEELVVRPQKNLF